MSSSQTISRSAGRVPLSRERILDAALQLALAEGLDRVTMRRLARELDVVPMALYTHVRDKQDLQEGMVDTAFGRMDVDPGAGAWDYRMRTLAHALRDVLLVHAAVVDLFFLCSRPGPNALRAIEAAHGVMRGAGFGDAVVAAACRSLYAYTLGSVTLEINRSGEAKHPVLLSLPAEQYPNTVALTAYLATCLPDEQFDSGLELMLAGLAGSTPSAGR